MFSDKSIVRPGGPTALERIAQHWFAATTKKAREDLNNQYNAELKCKDFRAIASFCGGGGRCIMTLE